MDEVSPSMKYQTASGLQLEDAYIVGILQYSFRAGEAAKIINVMYATPLNISGRACFVVRFDDGAEEYIAVEDYAHYRIISEEDYKQGHLPPVTE